MYLLELFCSGATKIILPISPVFPDSLFGEYISFDASKSINIASFSELMMILSGFKSLKKNPLE